MFVSEAFAQTASGGGGFMGVGGLEPLIPLVLIFVVFYFLLIRPQQKKAKAHKEMLAAVRRGDRVVTAGGLIGTVAKAINDRELQLEIADGIRVRVMRGMIAEVLTRTESAASQEEDEKPDKKERVEAGKV